MKPKNGKLMLPWLAGILLLIMVTLAACGDVEIIDKTPAASTPDSLTNPPQVGEGEHDLAVMAVDFDPPLSYQQLIVRREAVELLVVVENTGSATEQDVTVRAQLSTPENPDFLLTQGASVASIVPGEIQIVRFARLGDIPYHQTYTLEVGVDPVDGEIDLSNNTRAFTIQIHQE
jgi:hypothetical protein